MAKIQSITTKTQNQSTRPGQLNWNRVTIKCFPGFNVFTRPNDGDGDDLVIVARAESPSDSYCSPADLTQLELAALRREISEIESVEQYLVALRNTLAGL